MRKQKSLHVFARLVADIQQLNLQKVIAYNRVPNVKSVLKQAFYNCFGKVFANGDENNLKIVH